MIHRVTKVLVLLFLVTLGVSGYRAFSLAETPISSSTPGILEVRITDHREAIGDFEILNLTIASVGIHAAHLPGDQGWLDLEVSQQLLDLTRYVDGRYQVILEKEMTSGSYDGVRVKITDARGTLKDGKKLNPHVSVEPVALRFNIDPGKKTIITLDLIVLDKSDEAQGYEIFLKTGYVTEFSLLSPETAGSDKKIENIIKSYVKALYSRNYKKAYEFVSSLDRSFKTEEEYLRENPSFEGLTLELAEKLASFITYKNINSEIRGDRARVTVSLSLPDGNAPEIQSILFEEERPKDASRAELLEKLETLQKTGKIPMIEGEQPIELIKEKDQWYISLNWGNGIRVRFKGVVRNDLPWSFEPVQKEVLIQPGETLQNFYRVKNLSDKPVTGKALHRIEPRSQEQYLTITECFCFLQETLEPGEEKELPLTFQLNWDTPKDVNPFEVTYEFYPLEYFEEKWGKPPVLK